MEIWKDVVGYEGLYKVSNLGRIKSLSRPIFNGRGIRISEEKILNPILTQKGYFGIKLWRDSKRKGMLIHRLVAQAFIPNSYNYPEINHIDENAKNNNVENLEWCNHLYNMNYGSWDFYRKQKRKINPKHSKAVLQYDENGKFIKEWISATECERNGFSQSLICNCCKGRRNKHKGYIWKYKE